MRLRRLDLARFGKFTDKIIDFGEAPEGAPDLHVIYGPNEAGKSTAIAAVLDLLYGIEQRSAYNFLHPYATMKIGACLELASGPREIARIKRPQNSLLDADGQAISDDLLKGELAGIDRDAYCTMFSLNDETLEQGGKSILDSKGDLGELLFSATAGLADLSRSLANLRTEGDLFYKKGGQKTELADLKKRLGDLKARRDEIDTLATKHGQLVEARDRAREAYRISTTERTRVQTRLSQVNRLLAALPRLAQLQKIRRELDGAQDVAHAPVEWLRDLPALEKADVELKTIVAGFETIVANLRHEISDLPLDDAALSLIAAFEDCAALRSDHVGAQRDIPSRESELREAEREIADILRRLEKPDADPRELSPPARMEADLRALIGAFSGVDTALTTARRELADAQMRLASATDKLKAKSGGESPVDAVAIEVLQKCLSRSRKSDPDRLRALARQRDDLTAELKARMAALAPWRGELSDLRAAPLPDDATLESWKQQFTQAREHASALQARLEALRLEKVETSAAIEAFASVSGLLSEAEALDIRTRREAAWSRHRQTLDAASAEAFEAEMRRDDQASAARILQASEMARYNGHLRDLARLEPQLKDAQAALAAAEAQHAKDLAPIRAAANALGVPDNVNAEALPARIAAFKTGRALAIATQDALAACERDLAAAQAYAKDTRERLARALALFGAQPAADAGLDEVVEYADAVLVEAQRATSLRDAVTTSREDVKQRQTALDKIEAKHADWTAQWRDLCAACALFAGGPTPNVAQASAALAEVARLGPELLKQDGARDRIAKMKSNQQAFIDSTQALATKLGLARGDDPLAVFHTIEQRIATAKQIAALRDGKRADLEKAERDWRNACEKLRLHEAYAATIFERLRVSSLAEAETVLRDAVKRAELVEADAEIVMELMQAVGVESGEAAIAALESADRDALAAEATELAQLGEALNQDCEDNRHLQKSAEAKVEAIGGDDAVARIEEERQTILLEIASKAERYMRVRLGAIAAEQALRLYRDRHRGSMMAHASDAFQTISRGAYAKLTTQPEKDTETLVAVSADGSSKVASALSKGTRFQLYLALRVAGHHEFSRNRQPVPFIADDIMETFDDFRAEEAFRLFAGMAQSGQVIYLTHHRHLLDVVQKVCPQVKIHHLAAEQRALSEEMA